MTQDEFNIQMSRLKETWRNTWPEEKVRLIWTAVNQYSSSWFEKLVTKIITTGRQSPLPKDFIDAAKEQDRKIYLQSPQTKNYESVFSEEEIMEMFSVMKKAAMGLISPEQARTYADTVAEALRSKGITPDPY